MGEDKRLRGPLMILTFSAKWKIGPSVRRRDLERRSRRRSERTEAEEGGGGGWEEKEGEGGREGERRGRKKNGGKFRTATVRSMLG